MTNKIIILIDGGFLRVRAKHAGKIYNPDFIEKFAHKGRDRSEESFRVLYYDCAPFVGDVKLPVSGAVKQFAGSDRWMFELAEKLVRRSSRCLKISWLQAKADPC